MSEHTYPAAHPEESPDDKGAQAPNVQTSAEQEDEQTKGARYYDEAARLYLEHLQDPEGSIDRLEPMTEPWLAFETAYEGSFESRMAFVEQVMDELGWFQIIQKMTTHMGIPVGALRLDYSAVYDYLSRYFHIFDSPEGILHVFTRDGIKPMAADITWRGGRL